MKDERYLIKKNNYKTRKNIIFLIVLLVGFVFNKGSYYNENIGYKLDDISIELGDKLPDELKNYTNIFNSNNKYTIETNAILDEFGNTSAIGEYSYYLIYNDDIFMHSIRTNIKASLTVVDTVNPTINIKGKKEFNYGSKINVSDIFECYDLSGCKMYFEEEIDTYKSGKHMAHVVAEDGAGNQSKEKYEITILEKPVIKIKSNNYSSYDIHNNSLNSNLTEEEKNNLRNKVVEFALQFVGNPYVYGGTSLTNGTDCSGFTMSVYNNFGYRLPRIATSQGYVGKAVSYNELLPGDLIIFHYTNGGGHVGMYAGNGMLVHAGTTSTGIQYTKLYSGNKTYRRIIY